MLIKLKQYWNFFLICLQLNIDDSFRYGGYLGYRTTNKFLFSLQQMKLRSCWSNDNSPWEKRNEIVSWLWAIKQVMVNTQQQYLTKQIDTQRKHELYSACLDCVFNLPLQQYDVITVFNMLFDEIKQERASGKVITDMESSVVNRIY